MTEFVLLRGQKFHQGYALYQNNNLVANYSYDDYDWYITQQIESRVAAVKREKGEKEEVTVTEKDWDEDFPEKLGNTKDGEIRAQRNRRTNEEIAADEQKKQEQRDRMAKARAAKAAKAEEKADAA